MRGVCVYVHIKGEQERCTAAGGARERGRGRGRGVSGEQHPQLHKAKGGGVEKWVRQRLRLRVDRQQPLPTATPGHGPVTTPALN